MVKKYIYCYCKRDVRWDPIYLQNSYQLNNPPPLLLSQIFSTPKAAWSLLLDNIGIQLCNFIFSSKKKKKLCNFISSLLLLLLFMRVCNCRGYRKFLRELQFSISNLLSPIAMGQGKKKRYEIASWNLSSTACIDFMCIGPTYYERSLGHLMKYPLHHGVRAGTVEVFIELKLKRLDYFVFLILTRT